MVIYFVALGFVIACVEGFGQCIQVSGAEAHMSNLIKIGAVELIFEIIGAIKIYRSIDKNKKG